MLEGCQKGLGGEHPSCVAIGCARRAVHAGPSLWGEGADKPCVRKWWPFWNPCTRARSHLATPLHPTGPTVGRVDNSQMTMSASWPRKSGESFVNVSNQLQHASPSLRAVSAAAARRGLFAVGRSPVAHRGASQVLQADGHSPHPLRRIGVQLLRLVPLFRQAHHRFSHRLNAKRLN